jgi:hypothetical protein
VGLSNYKYIIEDIGGEKLKKRLNTKEVKEHKVVKLNKEIF